MDPRRIAPASIVLALACACCGAKNRPETECAALISDFQACGGDVIGTWDIDRSCLDSVHPEHILFLACPTASVSAEAETVGSLKIDRKNFTPRLDQLDLLLQLTVPMACLTAMGLDCAYVEDELNEDSHTDATCHEDEDECLCEAVQDLRSVWDGHLPYTAVSDTELLVDDPDGNDYLIPYCAQEKSAQVRVDFYTETGSAVVYFEVIR